MQHNAEPEAVDLLLEVERLDLLPPLVDAKSCPRTCLYLTSCAPYLGEPDDRLVLETAHAIYSRLDRHHDALRVALRLGDTARAEQTFAACADPLGKRQLAYLLARHGLPLDLDEDGTGPAATSLKGGDNDALRDDLRAIMSNSRLSEHYLALARDLDVLEPKVPEDVYKSHLAAEGRQPAGAAAVDSARANLAATLVNAFLNAGFGQDKLVTPAAAGGGEGGAEGGAAAGEGGAAAAAAATGSGDAVHWVFKNKDHGKAAAVASLGMVALWDVEGGLPAIDKYLYSTDPHVVAGALLAIGVLCCCVQNENDPGEFLGLGFGCGFVAVCVWGGGGVLLLRERRACSRCRGAVFRRMGGGRSLFFSSRRFRSSHVAPRLPNKIPRPNK
jgi:26S proteasome regulatory subunit N1